MPYSLSLFGCGKMGGAMLKSWQKNGIVHDVVVIEPHSLPDISQVKHLRKSPENIASDIIVLSIKPQILPELAKDLRGKISKGSLVLSIAAGQSLNSLSKLLGDDLAIIRAMPNTPAAIGKGISAAIGNSKVTLAQKRAADDLLSALGPVVWLDDESLMDAVTALSGSGPAYVFYLIEAMTKAGETLGLSSEDAMLLARQTVIGAGALAENESQISAQTLRENVTSPGGTTAAALSVLMDGRLQTVLTEALIAARDRGRDLNRV